MNDNDKTSNSGEPWESEMSTEFDRRVRDLHEAPLTLDQVRGKAINIRRKRRAAVAGSILAAAAVIVPVAVLAADPDGQETRKPVQPATTATEAPSQTPAPATPRVPSYVQGSTYHRADGSAFELPASTYDNAATLGDRVVASTRDDQGNIGIDVIEDDQVVESFESASDFVTSESGDTVAFVTSDGGVQTIWADDEATLVDGYDGWYVRAVTGGPDCLDPEAGNAGCRVFLQDGSAVQTPTAVDSHGLSEPAAPDAKTVYDADGEGKVAAVNKVVDAGSCGGVYDEIAGDYDFETCDYTVQRFSPDGALVTGAPAYLDGAGDSFVALLDATTGDEVARLDPPDSFVASTVWLDDDTIASLVHNYTEQTWSIVTLTLGDDAPVTVVGPLPGNDADSPIHLVR